MKFIPTLGLASMVILATGCASVVNETTQPVRIDTYSASGEEVKDMDCKTENDYGVQSVKTPGTVQVHRSNKDLIITCSKADTKDATGNAVSRANAGLAGNIIIGGGIGAVIDHARGTAYTYPKWIRLVVDKFTAFDRRADNDGTPNLGNVVDAAVAVAPGAAASAAK
jgi:hypothetical protein